MLRFSYIIIFKELARCLVPQTLPAQHAHSQLHDYECVSWIRTKCCAGGDWTGNPMTELGRLLQTNAVNVAFQVIGLGAPGCWTEGMGIKKKGNYIHDKPQVAELRTCPGVGISQTPGPDFRNSRSCVLELREFCFVYSFSLKNISGSCI